MEKSLVNYCQSHYYIKLKEFSNQLWQNTIIGGITALAINMVLFNSIRKNYSILATIIYEIIIYISVSYILTLINPPFKDEYANLSPEEEAKAKEMRALKNRSEAEQIAMVILNRQSQLKKWNKTETNFTRLITCSKMIIYAYFLAKIVNLFNDKFMVFLISNVIAFHGLIERYYPDSLFKIRISVKQIIEGVIGLIECLIPRYEEEKKQ